MGIKEHTKEWFFFPLIYYYYYLFILARGGGGDDCGDRTWTKICQILRQQKRTRINRKTYSGFPNSAGPTFVSFLDKWHVVGNQNIPCQIWMMLPPFFGKIRLPTGSSSFFFSFPFVSSAHMLTLEWMNEWKNEWMNENVCMYVCMYIYIYIYLSLSLSLSMSFFFLGNFTSSFSLSHY